MNNHTTTTPIVFIHNGQPTTTSLAIAEGTKAQHKNVLELIRQYQQDLELFGRVAFETRPFETPGGQQKQEIAILNERQTTLILTYMRNGPITRRFKIALVQAFYRMAETVLAHEDNALVGVARLIALWGSANPVARKKFLEAIKGDIERFFANQTTNTMTPIEVMPPTADEKNDAEVIGEIIFKARKRRDADVMMLCGYTLGSVKNLENPLAQAAIRVQERLVH